MSGTKSTFPGKVASTVGTSAPKERPILFSGPMVRAIMEGRKTQTRRLLAPQPEVVDTRGIYGVKCYQWGKRQFWPPGVQSASEPGTIHPQSWGGSKHLSFCPYGSPGDRLWVRETFRMGGSKAEYAADDYFTGERATRYSTLWRPSIFMPRCLSRILLEVVDVRVQQLQQITEEDAIAEGCNDRVLMGEAREGMAREDYRRLWDQINGKRAPWESNPWVWAVTFRRIEGGHG